MDSGRLDGLFQDVWRRNPETSPHLPTGIEGYGERGTVLVFG